MNFQIKVELGFDSRSDEKLTYETNGVWKNCVEGFSLLLVAQTFYRETFKNQSKTKGVERPSVVTEESTMAVLESLEDEARQTASHRTKY